MVAGPSGPASATGAGAPTGTGVSRRSATGVAVRPTTVGPAAGTGVVGRAGPVAAPGSRPPAASASSATNAPQVGGRSAGSLAIPRVRTVAMAAGSSGRTSVSAGGSIDMCAHSSAASWSRRNGGVPASSSKATQASAYRSARPSTSSPRICSGAT